MKKLGLLSLFIFITSLILSQSIKGVVVNKESDETLIGASIREEGGNGKAQSDLNGAFTIKLGATSGKLVITAPGFDEKTVTYTINAGETKNIGKIQMESNKVLNEVVVVGKGIVDIVKDRQTPIAVSTINRKDIENKVGNVELPDLLKNTPSVQTAGQAGGYGDSRMFLRGFDQTNTAFLLNGQPINGMEDGKMYWSNWAGMSDVANAIQVQRGLGSSKLAISSVGGTINIVTKTTENKKGGSFSQTIGNGLYSKSTATYSTGLTKSGFAFTGLLTYWKGEGWARGTRGEGQNYFFSVGYQASKNLNLNLLVTGAPQWHDQSYDQKISTFLNGENEFTTYNAKYNNNYGYKNGYYMTERKNFYHKPIANLNIDWTINEKMSLSTVLYGSVGRGGGTGDYGKGRVRTANGLIDFDKIEVNNNNASDTGTSGSTNHYGIRASMNNHNWYGAVANLNYKINDNLSLNIGADGRMYHGSHFRRMNDNLGVAAWKMTNNYNGLKYVANEYSSNPWAVLKNTAESDMIAYHNEEQINYIGGFGQLEYTGNKLSAFVQGALSNQYYQRFEYWSAFKDSNENSDIITKMGYNLKAGANYKFNKHHNLFFNAGNYSRQPYFDNIFSFNSNTVNQLAINETILGVEAGYGFRSKIFSANVNAYYTKWDDRTIRSSLSSGNDTAVLFNINQLHKGIEFDFTLIPNKHIELKGFASFGRWTYNGNAEKTYFNENLEKIESSDSVYIRNGARMYSDGIKIGQAAQTTTGANLKWNTPLANLSFDLGWNYYANLYNGISVNDSKLAKDTNHSGDIIRLPEFHLFDLGASYAIQYDNGGELSFRANVFNLFNKLYIQSISTNNAPDTDTSKNYRGINKSNSMGIGMGRTWNFTIRYKF